MHNLCLHNLRLQCIHSGTPVEGLGEHRKGGRVEAWGWGRDSRCGSSGGRPGYQVLMPCTAAVGAQGLCVLQVLWAMGGCDQPSGRPQSSVPWLLPSPKLPNPSRHPTSLATTHFHPPLQIHHGTSHPRSLLPSTLLQIHHSTPPPQPPPSSTLPCSCSSLSPLSSSNALATKQAWPCHSHLTPARGLPTTLRGPRAKPLMHVSPGLPSSALPSNLCAQMALALAS